MQVANCLAACFDLTLFSTVAASGARCRETSAVASGWTAVETEHICASVRTALDWLHTMGIAQSDGLVVRPKDERAGLDHGHALGRYDTPPRSVHTLSFDVALRASLERSPACGVPMTHEFWRSYGAHETARAAMEQNFAAPSARRTASAYVVAVNPLTPFPRATRGHIPSTYVGPPAWSSESWITSANGFLGPCAFADNS